MSEVFILNPARGGMVTATRRWAPKSYVKAGDVAGPTIGEHNGEPCAVLDRATVAKFVQDGTLVEVGQRRVSDSGGAVVLNQTPFHVEGFDPGEAASVKAVPLALYPRMLTAVVGDDADLAVSFLTAESADTGRQAARRQIVGYMADRGMKLPALDEKLRVVPARKRRTSSKADAGTSDDG